MTDEDGFGLAKRENVSIIAELQAKLRTTEAELERTRKQRDYVLRLLKQQQTLSTARTQNEAFAFYMEQNSVLAQLLSRVPRTLKDIIPLRLKQLLRNVVIKIG